MAVCLQDLREDDSEERRKGYKEKMKKWFQPLTLEIPARDPGEGLSSSSLSGRNRQGLQSQHFSPGRLRSSCIKNGSQYSLFYAC